MLLAAAFNHGRKFVPWRVRRRAAQIRDWARAGALGLRGRPRTVIFYSLSPGDDLLCTAVLRELRKRGQTGVAMVSNHPLIFVGCQDADAIWPAGANNVGGSELAIYRKFARLWGAEMPKLEYAAYDGIDHSEPPRRHIIAELCASAGISGEIALRPYFTLSPEERASAAWAADSVVIQNGGMGARHPMRNKEWCDGRFQAAVDALPECRFVQIGSPTDTALRNATDLRGVSIRESAAVLSNARLFVGTVGFPMHLARAVECPAVIVYGGREAPWQSGYVCNANLSSAPPCSPCWRWSTCDFDRRCMRDIGVDDAVSAIRGMLAKSRGPLAIETAIFRPLTAAPTP